jgi:hypothetical protein
VKATLRHYTVEQILEGFVYDELEGKGLFGLAGKLVIQPEYQRHYIYGDGKRDDGKDLRLHDGTCPYFRILIIHKASP